MKADLLNFPYFFSLNNPSKKVSLQERIGESFAPSINKIIDGYYKTELDLIALSSCHTATSGMDSRFHDYTQQLHNLKDHSYELDARQGILKIKRKKDEKNIILLHGQKIRAYHESMPVYVYALGINDLISPTRSLEETAKEIEEKKGIALFCDPMTVRLIDVASDLFKNNLINGVCFTSYGKHKDIISLVDSLKERKVPVLPVSGGHSYKTAGRSYIEVNNLSHDNFSIDGLKDKIKLSHFVPHYGSISSLRKFLDRDIHIYISIPFHLVAKGKKALELVKVLKSKGISSR